MMIETPSGLLRRALFLSAVLDLWDQRMDTNQIAKTLNEREETIERALHEALAKRRRHAETTGA